MNISRIIAVFIIEDPKLLGTPTNKDHKEGPYSKEGYGSFGWNSSWKNEREKSVGNVDRQEQSWNNALA